MATVVGISPLLQGKNGYLPSIGRKGRFLQEKFKKNGQSQNKEQKGRKEMARNPSTNTIRVSSSNLQKRIKKPANR